MNCSMWNRGGSELPQSKPDGFASSLGEGASGVPPTSVLALSVTCGASSPKGRASGETGDFAIYPITFPPCQGPHPRGGCLRSRLGEFRQIPPQALPRQLPQGDAFALCRKPYRHHQKLSPWGSWHRAAMTGGVFSRAKPFFHFPTLKS